MDFTSHSRFGRREFTFAGIALLGFLLFIEVASAQPQLNFKRIVNNWPTIELYFNVTCHGVPVYLTGQRYFRVLENGRDGETLRSISPRHRKNASSPTRRAA